MSQASDPDPAIEQHTARAAQGMLNCVQLMERLTPFLLRLLSQQQPEADELKALRDLGPALDRIALYNLARSVPVLAESHRQRPLVVIAFFQELETAIGPLNGVWFRLGRDTEGCPSRQVLERPAIAPVIVHQRAYHRR